MELKDFFQNILKMRKPFSGFIKKERFSADKGRESESNVLGGFGVGGIKQKKKRKNWKREAVKKYRRISNLSSY